MSLALDKKYALDRMNASAIKHSLGTELHKTKNNLKAIYDFSVVGGAVSTINLRDDDGAVAKLPAGAIITNVIYHVVTAVTSGGSATVALGVNTTTDLKAATAYNAGAPDLATANSLIAGIPVGTAATAVRCTAECNVQWTIATAALTAGKVHVFIEYMISA